MKGCVMFCLLTADQKSGKESDGTGRLVGLKAHASLQRFLTKRPVSFVIRASHEQPGGRTSKSETIRYRREIDGLNGAKARNGRKPLRAAPISLINTAMRGRETEPRPSLVIVC